ncbi:MAG: hypothetical protein LBE79_13190 [Tannerella sp.]|nr:hypothetical protein [Tannerella sp.]
MRKFQSLSLIFIALFAFFGCEAENFGSLHPNEGGITLTVDWSGTAAAVPEVYRARAVFASGFTRDFVNLRGATNLLTVEPGEAMLYVYNEAEHISISGHKARVNTVDGGIAANPGLLFTHSRQVVTEKGKEVAHTAVMQRQTGELRFSFAIKPASMISRVKSVKAVLEGVASEIDMQTNVLSAPAATHIPFSRNGYFSTATIRLLGFDPSAAQKITLDIELENGNSASVTSNLTSLVADFNQSKNALFSLNADLNISNAPNPAVTIDKWEQNVESRYLSVFPSEMALGYEAAESYIDIATDRQSWTYSITQTGNWLTATQSKDRLLLRASANTDSQPREAIIRITADGLSESVTLTQEAYVKGTYSDKEVLRLQSATVGRGVNIILMGDGYTLKDMDKQTGKYELDMRAAADHFFSVYPYTVYRDYFNVYMIAAISNQEGISIESTGKKVDNRFESIWEGGRSTGIDCNSDIVREYVRAIPAFSFAAMNNLTVIMPINANIYAGTCHMELTYEDYGNGFSISMCPVGSDFKEVVVHEAGGHGFAKLIDEYYDHPAYFPNETIPDEYKDEINEWKRYGGMENVDFYSDIKLTSWKGFAGIAKYHMVSAFEGAYMYGKGIWRPEYNSCMNNNVLYFNAPSRWAIVRRIMRLAGINHSFAQFLQDDRIPAYPATTRSYVEKDFVPLAPPVKRIQRNP